MASPSLLQSTLPKRQKKQLTYGKRAHNVINRQDENFVYDFPAELPAQTLPIPFQDAARSAVYNQRPKAVDKRVSVGENKPGLLASANTEPNVVMSRRIHHDLDSQRPQPMQTHTIFDVPSSDEEVTVRRGPKLSETGKSIHSRTDTYKPSRLSSKKSVPKSPVTIGALHSTKRRKLSQDTKTVGQDLLKHPRSDTTGSQPLSKSTVSLPGPKPILNPQPDSLSVGSVKQNSRAKQKPHDTNRKSAQHDRNWEVLPEPVKQGVRNNASDSKDGSLTADAQTLEMEVVRSTEDMSLNTPKAAYNPPRHRPSTPPERFEGEVNPLESTPKQSKLWSSLLPARLDRHNNAQESVHIARHRPTPSSSRATMPRLRLIDSLNDGNFSEILSSDTSGSEEQEHSTEQARLETLHTTSQGLMPNSAAASQQSSLTRSQSRLTYAGEQRSYLEDFSLTTDALYAAPIIQERSPPKSVMLNSNSQLSQKRGNESSHQDSDDEEGTRGMRSIHELRAAGDSFRFENDFPAEELEGGGKQFLSRKRNALLDICSRLADTAYQERFIQHGLELRSVVACRGEADVIIGTLVAGILIYVFQPQIILHSASQLISEGVLDLLVPLIDVNTDLGLLVKSRHSNMSKIAQSSALQLQDNLLQSGIWGDEDVLKSLSPRDLGFKGWELLTRKLRKDGDLGTLVNNSQVSKLINVAGTMVERLGTGSAEDQARTFTHLRTIFSLIESLTIAEICVIDETVWDALVVSRLADTLVPIMSSDSCRNDPIFALGLRICLNLANNHSQNSEKFSKPSWVRIIMDAINHEFEAVLNHTTSNLDQLLLSLGALLNLAEWSDGARLSTLSHATRLDTMLRVFLDSRKTVTEADSLAASSVNVAYGYLAILIGNLCKNDRVRVYIEAQLPEGSFKIVYDAVNEFLVHHKEADKANEGNHHWIAFTDRLAAVSEMLKQLIS